MSIRVAINGFGYIGRLAFRQMFGNSKFEIVAINDLTDSRTIAHLLKYDSAQGRYDKHISCDETSIQVDDTKILVFSEKEPKNLPWERLEADIILECTGRFMSKNASMRHIEAGAKRLSYRLRRAMTYQP